MDQSKILQVAQTLEIPDLIEFCQDPKFTQKICSQPEFWRTRFTHDFGGDISNREHPEIIYFEHYLNDLENRAWFIRHAYLEDIQYQRADSEVNYYDNFRDDMTKDLEESLGDLKEQYIYNKIRPFLGPNANLTIPEKVEEILTIVESPKFSTENQKFLNMKSTQEILRNLDEKLHLYGQSFEAQKNAKDRSNAVISEYTSTANKFRTKANVIRNILKIPRTLRAYQLVWRGPSEPQDYNILDAMERVRPGYKPHNLDLIVIQLPNEPTQYSLYIDGFISPVANLQDIVSDIIDYTGEHFTVETIKSQYRNI